MNSSKVTRKHVIYFGLLAAAAAGLTFDRLTTSVEGSDDPAALAVPHETAARRSAVVTPTSKSPAAPATPERRLAQRLVELAGPTPENASQIRNVFAPARIGLAGTAPDSGALLSKHTLNGVMYREGERRGVAIIDGRPIQLGGRLEGFVLIRLGPRFAVFSDGKNEVTLKLPEKK